MQKTCQCLNSVAEESKAGTFKESQGAYGQPSYFGPGVLKPFSMQVVQARVRETFADKHRAPSWKLTAASQ